MEQNDCTCETCVAACAQKPGWLAPGDAERIAAHLDVPLAQLFKEKLAVDWWERVEGDIFGLAPATTEGAPGAMYPADPLGCCVFLEDDRCSIHPVKPTECRGFHHTDERGAATQRRGKLAEAWLPHQAQVEGLLGEKPESEKLHSGWFHGLLGMLCLALVGCGDNVAPMPFDAGPDAMQTDAAFDAMPDAALEDTAPDIPIDTAPPVELGECRPYRDGLDHVTHADCAPLTATPVCDAISHLCVAEPEIICGACSAQAQCDDAQPGSVCAFLAPPDDGFLRGGDNACLWPCAMGCDWLEERWRRPTTCRAGFCVPDVASPNCRSGVGLERLP